MYNNAYTANDFDTAANEALNNSQEILDFSADLNKSISDRAYGGGGEFQRRYIPNRPAPMAGNASFNAVRPAIKFPGSPF